MRVTIEELPGVESATVSLNEGRAVIRLRAGNSITLAQIRQSVERNGFTPQQAVVEAEVEVLRSDGRIQLRIAGTSETYDVLLGAHSAAIQQQLAAAAGSRVLIQGVVAAQKDKTIAPTIQVTNVKPVSCD